MAKNDRVLGHDIAYTKRVLRGFKPCNSARTFHNYDAAYARRVWGFKTFTRSYESPKLTDVVSDNIDILKDLPSEIKISIIKKCLKKKSDDYLGLDYLHLYMPHREKQPINQENNVVESSKQDSIQENNVVESNKQNSIKENNVVESSKQNFIQENHVGSSKHNYIQEKLLVGFSMQNSIQENIVVESSKQNSISENLLVESRKQNYIQEDPVVESSKQSSIPENLVVESRKQNFIQENLVVESRKQKSIQENLVVESSKQNSIQENHKVEQDSRKRFRNKRARVELDSDSEEEEEKIKKKKNKKVKVGPRAVITRPVPEVQPELPKEIEGKIGKLNGSEIKWLITKRLFTSDVSKKHGRFSMPLNQIDISFLRDEEKKILNNRGGVEVGLVGPTGERTRKVLKKWRMDKPSGKVIITYNLINNWYKDIVEANGLERDQLIHVWSFREGPNLSFAFVKVDE